MGTSERAAQFSAPTWLRDTGFTSWLLVGFVLVIVGLIWLLSETSTIVMPVLLAAVLGAVAGPAVGWLERHRVPRVGGAILVLLGLVAIGALILYLVFAGLSDQSASISAKLNQALDKIQGWFADLGANQTEQAKADVQKAVPKVGSTLLNGISNGISGLSSLVFFLAFAVLSTLFVLKDGPVMHRFIDRHLGVPQPVAHVVTTNIAKSLRSYFLAVTIIAAFNAVLIALSTGSTSDALILAVVALLANGVLQQLIQPFVMGATLSLNPLVVLVVTIGAGALFGMVGLTLAAPLTSAAVHISNELREPEPEPERSSSGAAVVDIAPAPSG